MFGAVVTWNISLMEQFSKVDCLLNTYIYAQILKVEKLSLKESKHVVDHYIVKKWFHFNLEALFLTWIS